jgi:ribonuclease Y
MIGLFESIILIWALIMGLIIGAAMSRSRSRRIMVQARRRQERITTEASDASAQTLRQGETRAREEALKVRKDSELLERQSTEQNHMLEERMKKLEARNERREADLARREGEAEKRRIAVLELKSEARTVRHEAKARRQDYRVKVEELAAETSQQIRQRMSDAMVEETRADCADRLRNMEATEGEDLDRQAKRIMGISMGRYSAHFLTARMSATVVLPEGGAAKIQPHLALIEERSGVHLVPAESGESVRLEGGGGTEREMTRRALTRFATEQKLSDPEQLLSSIRADLDREILEKGKNAFRLLGLKPAHDEITSLLGRLNFRTSYTQNQWEHAVEASFLAGLMAAETGLDVRIARRATLLHDIGKALTHVRDGSHALIGAEYTRKYGEEEIISNAIASHHGDEETVSPYAHLVAAADAMSGARPGARREMVETYVDRLTDLERIATNFKGVTTVHAVQAGRELRVHVDEKRVNDQRAGTLSEEIAAKISDELTFPGQIRVTVIREFKAIEVA